MNDSRYYEIKKTFSFLLKVTFTFYLLTSLSCDKTTKPETVTFSGTVTLEGETDYSGVKVSLYKSVELDTALVRINQQYPQIGVQISQETEFDHREHSPLYSTTTNASGSWSIEDATPGTYNVVAEKDSFGWRYLHDQSSSNSGNITLKKVISLSGSITQNMTFDNNFIEVNGNTFIETSSKINFLGYNYLKFNGNFKVTIKGYISIHANAKIFVFTDSSDIDGKVNFEDIANLELKNIFIFNNIRFTVFNSTVEISNSIFHHASSLGLSIDNTNATIENNIVRDSDRGCSFDEANGLVCKKNVFIRNVLDIEYYSSTINEIKNNYFIGSIQNINFVAVNGNIQHNHFQDADKNIWVSDISNISIVNNNFMDNYINIETSYVSHQPNSVNLSLNYNNFINTEMKYLELGNGTMDDDTTDARNNYWEKFQKNLINEKITSGDKTKIVVINPFLYDIDEQAGIQK